MASGPDFSAKFSAPPEFSGRVLENNCAQVGREPPILRLPTHAVRYQCATVTLFIIPILRVFMQMFPLLVLLVASMLLLWSMMLLASILLKVFLLLSALLLLASMLLSLLMLFLAPMYLLVFLRLLALLLLAWLHYECYSMMSLLLLFFPSPCQEKSSGLFGSLEGSLLHSPMPRNSGPWSKARSHSRGQTFMAWRNVKRLFPGTGRLFRHLGMQKVSFQGPEKFSAMGNVNKIYGWREKFPGISI